MFFFQLISFSHLIACRKSKDKNNKDRIKLKINNDNKFLGLSSDNKLTLVDYEDALFIKLNSMENISNKSLEGKNSTVLTEKGWWFFPKSYSFQENNRGAKQQFKIVYFGPNEYILMKDDACLGFSSPNNFKRMDCKLGSAAIFNMCRHKDCQNLEGIRRDLDCVKSLLQIGAGGRNSNGYDDSDSDSDSDNRRRSRNKGRRRQNDRRRSDDSDSSDYGSNRYSPIAGLSRVFNGGHLNPNYCDNSDERYGGYNGNKYNPFNRRSSNGDPSSRRSGHGTRDGYGSSNGLNLCRILGSGQSRYYPNGEYDYPNNSNGISLYGPNNRWRSPIDSYSSKMYSTC